MTYEDFSKQVGLIQVDRDRLWTGIKDYPINVLTNEQIIAEFASVVSELIPVEQLQMLIERSQALQNSPVEIVPGGPKYTEFMSKVEFLQTSINFYNRLIRTLERSRSTNQ